MLQPGFNKKKCFNYICKFNKKKSTIKIPLYVYMNRIFVMHMHICSSHLSLTSLVQEVKQASLKRFKRFYVLTYL